MAEDKYINTTVDINTTATTINIFVEYDDNWILLTGYWDDENSWDDNAIWND